MLEHLRLYSHLYLEIICLLTALLNYRHLKKSNGFIYFIPFLFITVVVELSAKFLLTAENENNGGIDRSVRYMMFNIFTTFEFIFYSWIFLFQISSNSLKKIISVSIPVYAILVIVNIFFVQGIYKFHTYTYLLGSFLMVVYSCFFFYESILPDYIKTKLSMQPFFWICIGLLIFYLGSVIINALFEYLTSAALKKQGTRIYSFINSSLNVVLYGAFSIGFVLCRNNRKISSSPL